MPFSASMTKEEITEYNRNYYRNRRDNDEGFSESRKQYAKSPERKAAVANYQKTEQGKAAQKRATLKYKYNLTEDIFSQMMNEQSGKCANRSCGNSLTDKACVDHDHSTGKIRGLLCHPCNIALGMCRDNINILNGLIDYLTENACASE